VAEWRRAGVFQSIIESFVPETSDPAELESALDLSANYIRRLTVGQLLPRPRDPRSADTDDSAAAAGDDAVDHFDFSAVLPRLQHVDQLEATSTPCCLACRTSTSWT